MTLKVKLRASDSPPRPPFTFATQSPPADDDGHGPTGGAAQHPRPPGDFLPERDMHMYGAQPLEGIDEPGRAVVRCVRCGRAVLEWAAAEHRRICSHVLDGAPLTVKKGTKAEKKVTDGKKRRASEDTPDGSPSKKRARVLLQDSIALGSDDELDLSAYKGLKKSEIKKLLKERERLRKRAAKEAEKARAAERRRARANNPLDYDRQCGVINDKGLPCSRSLTCKTHTVGAKRAVQGRTRPYDELFIEWQRAHNPNFKEPVPKRDRESKAAAAAVADRKAAAAAKKKRAAAADEDGLRFDEDGAREMEELIRATRIAGDRVRSASLTGPSLLLGGEGGGAGAAAGPAMGARTPANGAVPARASPPFSSPWRTTTYEQISMGDLLTKALAARPRPGPTSIAPQRIGSQSKPGPAVVPPLVGPATVIA